VLVDASGNIFIADPANNVVREVEASTGNIKTVAGNHKIGYSGDGGPALNAEIIPTSIAFGSSGNLLIAAETFPGTVRSVAGLLSTTAPTVSLSGTSLSFGTTYVGVAATAQTITLTNSGTAALSVTSIAVSGANSGDFAQTNTCGTSVDIGAKCTISVTFTPGSTGPRSASVTISDKASGSPQSIGLSGAGIAVSLAMASGSSASQTVKAGQTAAYNLQLTATGGAAPTDQVSATITCTGAPAETTCNVPTAAVVATPATPGTFQITVKTTGSSAALVPTVPFGPGMQPPTALPTWLVTLLVFFFCASLLMISSKVPSGRLRTVRVALAACLVMLPISTAMMLTGCGGGSASPKSTTPGTYTLTVTATIGSQTKTTQLTLVVQ
jgi:hypothetical protein